MDDTVSPLEAPLAFIVKLKAENNNFINKELLLAQKAAGFKRKVAGFEMIDRGIARNGYEVCNAEGKKIGEVRSKTGTEIYIKIREKLLKAVTVKMPFYEG